MYRSISLLDIDKDNLKSQQLFNFCLFCFASLRIKNLTNCQGKQIISKNQKKSSFIIKTEKQTDKVEMGKWANQVVIIK